MVVMIRGFIEMFRKMRAWLDARAYPPRDGVADRRVANWAFGLFLADIVFMIRGYAVSNLVETLLFRCSSDMLRSMGSFNLES